MVDKKDPFEILASKAGIEGGRRNGNVDAFRHIYTSAQTTKAYGALPTRVLGSAHEWATHIFSKNGNPTDEWQMDEHNNAIGIELGQRAEAENWDDDRLVQEVGKVIKSGRAKVLTRSEDPNAPTGYPGYGAGEEAPVQKLVYPLDRGEAAHRKNAKPLFASWQHGGKETGYNPFRTPPIVAQNVPQTTSEPASILDSLLMYFRKK